MPFQSCSRFSYLYMGSAPRNQSADAKFSSADDSLQPDASELYRWMLQYYRCMKVLVDVKIL